MKTISKDPGDDFGVQSTTSCNDNDVLNQLETKTSLDRGQCQALLAALTREFAFIQGPPGTGKSYLGLHVMRVLLDVKKEAKLGPILVV
jgi:superfamily II DNA or RNA helicase